MTNEASLAQVLYGNSKEIVIAESQIKVFELGGDNLAQFSEAVSGVVHTAGRMADGLEGLSSVIFHAPSQSLEIIKVGLRLSAAQIQSATAPQLRVAGQVLLELNKDFLVGIKGDVERLLRQVLPREPGSSSSISSSELATVLPTSGSAE
jgi:hypothetical protein